jgi:hypothetical protein
MRRAHLKPAIETGATRGQAWIIECPMARATTENQKVPGLEIRADPMGSEVPKSGIRGHRVDVSREVRMLLKQQRTLHFRWNQIKAGCGRWAAVHEWHPDGEPVGFVGADSACGRNQTLLLGTI